MNTEVSLYVPRSHPLAILFLSLASLAAFNKSLVCSFFHLASFGFILFLSVLWNCSRLTPCNIFHVSRPVDYWWVCLVKSFYCISSFVLIPSEAWLTADLSSAWSCSDHLMESLRPWRRREGRRRVGGVKLKCNAGFLLYAMILNNPPPSRALPWPFQFEQVSLTEETSRVTVETNSLCLSRWIIKIKHKHGHRAYLASVFITNILWGWERKTSSDELVVRLQGH